MRTVLFLALAAFTIAGCGELDPLKISAKRVGDNIRVRYDGAGFLGKCAIRLNLDYRVKVARLDSGQYVTVPIRNFMNGTRRFKLFTPIETFYIRCENVPDGSENDAVYGWK